VDLCEEGAYTEAELAAYEKYWDIVRTEIATNKASRAEGLAEGEALGFEKGKVEGEALGLEKGKVEGEALGLEKGKAEVVRNSSAIGLPVETIATITQLST
jgi:predicted transposase YdaD